MFPVPNFLIVSLLSVIIFIIFLQKWLSRTASTPQQRLPPSPRKLPLIGNLHQLGVFPHRSLESLSKHYGGLMLLHLGKVPLVVASSSDAAREILKNQDMIFANRPKLYIADKLFYGSRDVGFSPYGEYWRQVRSICMLQLLSKKRVQSFHSVREEETLLMVERIRQMAASSSSVVNLSDAFASLANDVICRVALGRKYSDEGKMFNKLVREFMESLGASSLRDYIPWLGWIDRFSGLDSKTDRVFKGFDEFLNGVIEEHRRNRIQGGDEAQVDFVNILLDLQTDQKEKSFLDHDSIKAVILDMFADGIETYYTALVWTMAELVRNPKKMKILQREVREVAVNKDTITEVDLCQMHYLKATIKESIRLHPPVPLLAPHESTAHTKVLGYDIPKGTQVMVNAWAIGRDPLIWENPETFYPERFLDSDIDYRGHHFEFIPFSSGRRMCPGMTFAEHVVELALARLVHEFDFAMPNGESFENLDMSEGNGMTVRKRIPLVLVANPHNF